MTRESSYNLQQHIVNEARKYVEDPDSALAPYFGWTVPTEAVVYEAKCLIEDLNRLIRMREASW